MSHLHTKIPRKFLEASFFCRLNAWRKLHHRTPSTQCFIPNQRSNMFQRAFLLFCLTAALSLTSAAAVPSGQKLHPSLQTFVATANSASNSATLEAMRADGRVPVVIYTHNPEALSAAGIQINSTYAGFATGTLSAQDVSKAADLEAVTYIRPSHRAYPDNDLSKMETGAQALQQGFINQTAYKGKGAIVLIYDTGIDWRHLDFRDPQDTTRSRILYIWDQTIDATGSEVKPSGFSYGVEYTKAQIEAEFASSPPGFVRESDINGHGTHVAGTAAGNGNTISRFAGIAPEADLIIVKGGNNYFNDGPMIDGLTYAAAKATALGKPIVVNWSLGGMWGPHDATTPTAKAIDALCATAGHFQVHSAGNSGLSTVPIHISGTIANGGSSTVTIRVPAYTKKSGNYNDQVGLFLTFNSADSCSLTVQSPGSRTFTLASGAKTFADTTEGTVTLENRVSADNGFRQLTLWIEDKDTLHVPTNGVWTFTMSAASGNVTYNGWLDPVYIGTNSSWMITMDNADNLMTVNESCANNNLMVGSYFTRYSWPYYGSSAGQYAYYTYNYNFGDQIGQVSPFSSRGPSRDGRTKPDLVAPGHYVISPMSSTGSYGSNLVHPSRKYAALSGTSMAAPNATGCVAVMLARYPTMTANEIRTLFTSTVVTDSTMGTLPNNSYGNGKINVFRAIANRLYPSAVTGQRIYRYDRSGMSFNGSYMDYWVTATSTTSCALRFTPGTSGTIMGVSVGIRGTSFTGGAGTSLNCDIYSNTSGSLKGIPGTKIAGVKRVLDSLDYWTTVHFDLLPQKIAVAAGTDYHVVLSMSNAAAGDSIQILADDGTANNDNRSSMRLGSTWTNSGSWSTSANRNIRIRPVILSTSASLAVPGEDENVPLRWVLEQNYPNPFNPVTIIRYQVPVASSVRLAVYDLLGREVSLLVNEKKEPGTHQVTFDGSHLSTGVYFYRMEAGAKVETRKFCLLK
jgi:minor extracellular serine protease Vpr